MAIRQELLQAARGRREVDHLLRKHKFQEEIF
jgi:hypothetical protein